MEKVKKNNFDFFCLYRIGPCSKIFQNKKEIFFTAKNTEVFVKDYFLFDFLMEKVKKNNFDFVVWIELVHAAKSFKIKKKFFFTAKNTEVFVKDYFLFDFLMEKVEKTILILLFG